MNDLNNLLPFIGPPLRESFSEFYHFDEEKANEAVQKYREYYSKEGIFDNRVYDGIVDCLKKLKEDGKRLYVATSKPEKFAKEIIEHYHLNDFFDFVGGSLMNE